MTSPSSTLLLFQLWEETLFSESDILYHIHSGLEVKVTWKKIKQDTQFQN